jgi:TctA family transporter
MSIGIPGDAVMALILGALLIHGIQPGPQLITEHADLFWGLSASLWVGNVLLMILNVPLIGIWVKLLRVPFRYMYPAALFFIAVGVYSTGNSLFHVYEVLFFGIVGAILLTLDFPVAPILLGNVLGPLVEENFRRTVLLSHGSLEAVHPAAHQRRVHGPVRAAHRRPGGLQPARCVAPSRWRQRSVGAGLARCARCRMMESAATVVV